MITGSAKWYTIASRIRTAVHNGLTVTPDRSGVVPGAIAWDACDCGMLAVSIARVYPSERFPEEATTRDAPCDAPWEVGEVVIQVIRCAPNPEGDALFPTVAALDTSARAVLLDGYETLLATSTELCTMDDNREISDYLIRAQVAQGPEGGCVGSELRALVALTRN